MLVLSIAVSACQSLAHSVVSDSLWLRGLEPTRVLGLWGFSRQEHWSGLPAPPPGRVSMAEHCSAVCVHTYDRVRCTAFYGAQCPTVHMSHSCFTHSSAGGQLGYFLSWLLWTVLRWTLGYMHPFQLQFPQGICPVLPPAMIISFNVCLIISPWLSLTPSVLVFHVKVCVLRLRLNIQRCETPCQGVVPLECMGADHFQFFFFFFCLCDCFLWTVS